MNRRNFIKKTATGITAGIVLPTIVPSTVFGKSAPSNKIQIGQIGFGRIARSHDLPETIKYDIARVIAISDVDSKRMKEGKQFIDNFYSKKSSKKNYLETKMYDDYHDMILNKDIDAVIISTPDHWHAQPAVEAALAGKDIYLQKPTSLTIHEGRVLSDIVKKKAVILQMGTQQRSSPQFRIAAELVRNGRIGKIHTVKIGLPGDPAGPEATEMPVPDNLNYDMWLGSTPDVYYTEIGVHPQHDYSRPGWLRLEQFGAGMITGWGQHHIDSANWGLDTEYTNPVEIEAMAQFPRSGLWNVHGDFMVRGMFENGVEMLISGGYPNGIRYIGTEGWIFVSRGNYQATASDPVAQSESSKALDASDPAILTSEIREDEIHLYQSKEQHGNWLDSVQSREEPISPVEPGHRACATCLISHIAMKIPGKLKYDPKMEKFLNNDEANLMLRRPNRKPYGLDHIKYN
ncbi:MAG: Gfo/Idh/MocA family oxidoreductase [Bacteroidota bacterium]|nr:Gfo/Idh/MocA family oxidoreductase [Bacteroidota bacterium]